MNVTQQCRCSYFEFGQPVDEQPALQALRETFRELYPLTVDEISCRELNLSNDEDVDESNRIFSPEAASGWEPNEWSEEEIAWVEEMSEELPILVKIFHNYLEGRGLGGRIGENDNKRGVGCKIQYIQGEH